MLAVLKRVGRETLLFVLSVGVGIFVFIALGVYDGTVTDSYWSAHGFPPPRDYAFNPEPFKWLFTFGPWMLLMSARLLLWALRPVRPSRLSAR